METKTLPVYIRCPDAASLERQGIVLARSAAARPGVEGAPGAFVDDCFGLFPPASRPGWLSLLARIEQGGVDEIGVCDTARIARPWGEFAAFLARPAKRKLRLFTGRSTTFP